MEWRSWEQWFLSKATSCKMIEESENRTRASRTWIPACYTITLNPREWNLTSSIKLSVGTIVTRLRSQKTTGIIKKVDLNDAKLSQLCASKLSTSIWKRDRLQIILVWEIAPFILAPLPWEVLADNFLNLIISNLLSSIASILFVPNKIMFSFKLSDDKNTNDKYAKLVKVVLGKKDRSQVGSNHRPFG